jgi:hypothetical protein
MNSVKPSLGASAPLAKEQDKSIEPSDNEIEQHSESNTSFTSTLYHDTYSKESLLDILKYEPLQSDR